MLESLLQYMKRRSQAGIREENDPELNNVLFLSNVMADLILFAVVLNVPVFLVLVGPEVAILTTCVAVIYFFYGFYNRKGWYNFSRIVLIIQGTLIVSLYAVLFGKSSGVHLMYFTLIFYPFIIFLPHERRFFIFSFTYTSIIVIAFFVYHAHFGPLIALPTKATNFLEPIMFFTTIGLSTFLLLSLYLSSKNAKRSLEVAKSDAEHANQTKSDFLAATSHELRTPLNAIIGYSELLQEEAKEQELPDFLPDLEKIHFAGKHLLSLLNGLLDLSKIEAGKMELKPSHFAFAQFSEDLKDAVHPLLTNNNNTFVLSIEETITEVFADRVKLFQCLLNLIGNACKFCENGEVRLVCTLQEVEGKKRVFFAVQDQGIGIPTEELPYLFDKFTQVDSRKPSKSLGTGLGLAITNQLVQLMGGKLKVQSQLGKGSTFSFALPAELPSS